LCVAAAHTVAEPITYAEHIRPIFQNSCLSCHNPDKKKAGLDLSTYQATIEGSDAGTIVEPGNASKSLLYRVVAHLEEPMMPLRSEKLPDSQIELIKKWIEANAPENSGSALAKKTNDVAPVAVEEKPKGPPSMPLDPLLEPVVHAQKAGAISAMAASPWAPLVAVAGQKQVLFYNSDTLALTGILPFPEGFPDVLKFSRDGKLLLAGGGIAAKSGRVVVWDVASGQRVVEVGEEFDSVLAADISADRTRIALGGPGKLVKIYSARDGSLLHKMKKHTDWVTALSFTPDGKSLVTGDRAGGLVVWDTEGRELQTISAHKGAITSVACFANTVASASEDGSVKFWDIREGRETKSWNAHNGGVTSLAFASDGRIVTCGRDRVTRLWDANGNKLQQFEAFDDIAMQAAFAGGKIFAGDWTGALRVWTPDGKHAGDLDVNPPTLAERADAATKRLSELQPRHRKLLGARTDWEGAFAKMSSEIRQTNAAIQAKQVEIKTTEVQLAALAKDLQTANMTLQKAQEESAQIETDSGAMNTPDQTAQDAAKQALSDKTDAAKKLQDEISVTQNALEKQKADLAKLNKTLAPETEQTKAAEATLAKARQEEASIAKQLSAAKAELAQWRAAQINVTLHAARDELAKCEARQQQAVADARAAAAPLDKARADLAATERVLADGPERTKKCESEIADAHKQIDDANAAATAAQQAIAPKESLANSAAEFFAKIQADATKSPDDKTLVDAVAKAKETLDLLNRALTDARANATARKHEIEQATARLSAAENVLAQAKADAENAPEKIRKLRASVDEIAAKTADARTKANAAIEAANKKIADAKTAVENSNRDYHVHLDEAKSLADFLTVASHK